MQIQLKFAAPCSVCLLVLLLLLSTSLRTLSQVTFRMNTVSLGAEIPGSCLGTAAVTSTSLFKPSDLRFFFVFFTLVIGTSVRQNGERENALVTVPAGSI